MPAEGPRTVAGCQELRARHDRLLGKEAEGYLDTVYLSERLRISRGNKGTTFILSRL